MQLEGLGLALAFLLTVAYGLVVDLGLLARIFRYRAALGLSAPRPVSEEASPVLLERLEKYGEARLCPGGRMLDADRVTLNALLLASGAAMRCVHPGTTISDGSSGIARGPCSRRNAPPGP